MRFIYSDGFAKLLESFIIQSSLSNGGMDCSRTGLKPNSFFSRIRLNCQLWLAKPLEKLQFCNNYATIKHSLKKWKLMHVDSLIISIGYNPVRTKSRLQNLLCRTELPIAIMNSLFGSAMNVFGNSTVRPYQLVKALVTILLCTTYSRQGVYRTSSLVRYPVGFQKNVWHSKKCTGPFDGIDQDKWSHISDENHFWTISRQQSKISGRIWFEEKKYFSHYFWVNVYFAFRHTHCPILKRSVIAYEFRIMSNILFYSTRIRNFFF